MFRFPKDDLTDDELAALQELVTTGLLKMKTDPDDEKKLVRLRYARRTEKGLVATARGVERVGGRRAVCG